MEESYAAAAIKIQCAYRSYRIRCLFRLLASVNNEANRLQSIIQDQDTVDAIRRRHHHSRGDEDKIRINEALMRLLLKLDSVPGFDPAVRDVRRSLARRIIGLQEILDAIANNYGDDDDDDDLAQCDLMALIQQSSLLDGDADNDESGGGGYEVERFCADSFGFPCLQKFLRN